MLTLVPDPGTSLLFAALVLFDGFRRRSTGDLVLRQIVLGPWHIPDAAPANGYRLVHWWPPLIRSVLLPPLSSERIPTFHATAIQARRVGLHGASHDRPHLRLPFLTAHFGFTGLLQALGALLIIASHRRHHAPLTLALGLSPLPLDASVCR